MSRICEKCGKGPKAAIKRSHSMIKTKTRKYPNLQTKRIDGKKLTLCTKCIKTLVKVQKKTS
ncbi:50S ribosomal protein L28 [Candidatus Falkowbacteria bacterium]|nr:50S ribosomal protein L28 [Candidatus Falkowbacteria bacterium]MBT5502979.1 50S ribosomal protein L28 [Candidatus Falkowbacteria bacterium]MBT6574335.1 50S ribosomal protein L28 [Candidatus Falkowbacteria bacterium]MBT7349072.1 50S ribosomal protein L28 [Candidatus Falkowbacteria bacterium]MBT7500934.1 50S ribosomal protein L28 [Candidatus Falkowbacteria bacterium]